MSPAESEEVSKKLKGKKVRCSKVYGQRRRSLERMFPTQRIEKM